MVQYDIKEIFKEGFNGFNIVSADRYLDEADISDRNSFLLGYKNILDNKYTLLLVATSGAYIELLDEVKNAQNLNLSLEKGLHSTFPELDNICLNIIDNNNQSLSEGPVDRIEISDNGDIKSYIYDADCDGILTIASSFDGGSNLFNVYYPTH